MCEMPLQTVKEAAPESSELMGRKLTRLEIPQRLRKYFPIAVVASAFVFFAVRMFRLISEYAVNIFFSDQWEFNDATLFQKHSIWQMFRWQVGPHRQGLGSLFEKLIEPSFAWNSRTESFIVGGVIVVAALCALWLKKRLYGKFSTSDVLIAAVFFIPGQFETLYVTANFAHGPFPLLLIVLYCLAWTHPKPLVRYVLVLVINFFTIYTGFGLLLGFLTPLLLLLDHWATGYELRLPNRYVASAIGLSLLSLGSFFVDYKFDPAVACFSPVPMTPKYYVVYVSLMFAKFLGFRQPSVFQQFLAGAIVIVILLASALLSAARLVQARPLNYSTLKSKRLLIPAALITYCLMFCLMTAYGRLCSGLLTYASRYVIYLELGVLGLYFHLLNIPGTVVRRFSLGLLLLVIFSATMYVDREEMGYFPAIKQRWRTCYLQTGNLDRCDLAAGMSVFPPRRNLQKKLDFLKKNRLNLFANSEN